METATLLFFWFLFLILKTCLCASCRVFHFFYLTIDSEPGIKLSTEGKRLSFKVTNIWITILNSPFRNKSANVEALTDGLILLLPVLDTPLTIPQHCYMNQWVQLGEWWIISCLVLAVSKAARLNIQGGYLGSSPSGFQKAWRLLNKVLKAEGIIRQPQVCISVWFFLPFEFYLVVWKENFKYSSEKEWVLYQSFSLPLIRESQ